MTSIQNQAIKDAMDSLLVCIAHARLTAADQVAIFEALHFLENALAGAGIYEENRPPDDR